MGVYLPVLALLCIGQGCQGWLTSTELDGSWMEFKQTYDKSYLDEEEETYRRAVWEKNLNYIAKHNIRFDLGLESFNLGINEYSDLSLKEFAKTLLGARLPVFEKNETKVFELSEDVDYPDTVDWRTKGFVTPIKNQGACGSCWAFSSTGALEGQVYRTTGRLVSLSEQNLVDCSRPQGNAGCGGGWMSQAFTYVQVNRGIDTEAGYPYQGVDATCRYNPNVRGATCRGFAKVQTSEASLMAAVATLGPISVAIDANHQSFMSYRSGVFNEPTCKTNSPDHAVLVVGYGTYQGKPYWLVKNSWGTSWGIQGYIMMSRNLSNQCGIANYACYPVV